MDAFPDATGGHESASRRPVANGPFVYQSATAATGKAAAASGRTRRLGLRPWLLLAAVVGAIAGGLTAGLVVIALDEGTAVPAVTETVTEITTAVSTDGREGAQPTTFTQPKSPIDVKAVYEAVKDSVVQIKVYSGGTRPTAGSGSGFVIASDGVIATNAHVVNLSGALSDPNEDSVDIFVRFSDGSESKASVVGIDPKRDLAVISVDATGLQPVKLGQVEGVEVGDEVIAVGNALSLGATPTVTVGIVSAVERSIEVPNARLSRLIQTDAAINPGNSGGPLLNAAAEVIGINTAIAGDRYDGVGFAISVESARPVIGSLEKGVVPGNSLLGIRVISSERWEDALDNDDTGDLALLWVDQDALGAVVIEVLPDSASDRAGIKAGDVVVELDGVVIFNNQDLLDVVRSLLPGSEAKAVVARLDGAGTARRYAISVTLGET